MSGLPPLATELRTSLLVRFVPKAEVSDLFDHLGGVGQKCGWGDESVALAVRPGRFALVFFA